MLLRLSQINQGPSINIHSHLSSHPHSSLVVPLKTTAPCWTFIDRISHQLLKRSICLAYFNVWNHKTWQFYARKLHEPFNVDIVFSDQLLYNKVYWTLTYLLYIVFYNLHVCGWRNTNNSFERLPVSCSACKELEYHHSALTTNKKLNRWKNQPFFLDP